jgi:hypothetical protein
VSVVSSHLSASDSRLGRIATHHPLEASSAAAITAPHPWDGVTILARFRRGNPDRRLPRSQAEDGAVPQAAATIGHFPPRRVLHDSRDRAPDPWLPGEPARTSWPGRPSPVSIMLLDCLQQAGAWSDVSGEADRPAILIVLTRGDRGRPRR